MSPEDVRNRVATINTLRWDDETAHGEEDDLYEAVLRVIADGAANAPELAREALKTKTIRFARWCA